MQLIDVFYRIEAPKGLSPVYNISVNQISMYWKKVIFFENRQAAFFMQGYINHFLYSSLKIDKRKPKFYFNQIQTLNFLKLIFIFLPYSFHNSALSNKSLVPSRFFLKIIFPFFGNKKYEKE